MGWPFNIVETINDLLFFVYAEPVPGRSELPYFYIHASIVDKWEIFMNTHFSNIVWHLYEQPIQIDTKCFDMRLICVPKTTKDERLFLIQRIIDSQFSFPWEDNPALFINEKSFNVMEKFIKKYKLQQYILEEKEMLGITASNDETIIIVSFDENVLAKFDIIREYQYYYYTTMGQYPEAKYYYMTNAFPWHAIRNDRMSDDIFSVFPIILRNFDSLNYELNLMDLVALRLALNDVRDPGQSIHINYEIDFMIKRKLLQNTKNNHLDMNQYLIDNNIKSSHIETLYLAYEFQEFFKSIQPTRDGGYTEFIELRHTIKLADEIDTLKTINTVKERFNVIYYVDGRDFDQMSLSLFLDFAECANVTEIELDTNYQWIQEVANPDRTSNKHETIYVHLKGDNGHNFTEDFITAIKTIQFDIQIYLDIRGKLNDYSVFDNLKIAEIELLDITIDSNILESLHLCTLKTKIKLCACYLENKPRNWELLYKLHKIVEASFLEDEDTWATLFEFVWDKLRTSNSKQFQFIWGPNYEVQNIDNITSLNNIRFTINEENTKLEMRDIDTNKLIDLFDEKIWLEPDDPSDYEFYQ